MTVASFNVLNYFTTIDDGTNNARGADSDVEFQRQQAKTVAAIRALQADVIGLMEIENTAKAEADLVAALNADHGSEVYVGCGVPKGFSETLGGADAIRVGLIYRRDRVESLSEVAMITDPAFAIARTPLMQTFRSVEGGQPFTVIVNHFKSKGGDDEADPENQNKGDGQGAFNAARRKQAIAITKAIETMKVDGQEPRVLVIGDLNAYRQEDPIDVLRSAGLVDLHASNQDEYSFVYYGQAGSLDHAFASPALAQDVTGVATWHINSDEPRFLDYNTEFQPEALYRPNPWRSSDHDPVLIGIKR
jgi:predicted extracellular nuclease